MQSITKKYEWNAMLLDRKIFIFFILIFTISSSAYDKWIVVTTIQYPTPQLKKLAHIEGWHLLVVGDKKTPRDWYLENCEYLSPEKQLSLGYELTPLLPWNHYSRKNIGYLYAVEHGATILYDTDDDNEPLDGLKPLAEKNNLPSLTASNLCVNIYAYFEKPTMWPRGYPLEYVKNGLFNISAPIDVEIGIEQGLVNGDPDVDAIFREPVSRLTQLHEDIILFTPKPSCVLAQGMYCPFNSQNTFFHNKAFFTLYLPSSVSMRVSDIWRGYYAQKLIQLLNLSLAFSGPSAMQERNNHDLLNDFSLEDDLYLKSGQLIKFLSKWNLVGSGNNLNTMERLFQDLIDNNFLKHSELALCKAWLRDFERISTQ